MTKEILTVAEVAEYLGIGINAAYSLMHAVGFPSFRVSTGRGNGQWRVRSEALQQWVRKQELKKPVVKPLKTTMSR